MGCMKSIEEPYLTTLLNSIISNTDICTISNEKENEGIEKQKADIEAIQHITKTKKSIRTRDETSKMKNAPKKCKVTKNLKI